MKILPVDKIREADAFTIKNEPIESIDLMERAARVCHKWIKKRTNSSQPVKIFCGPGNNGGDGIAIARMLLKNYFEVHVYVLHFTDKFSADFTLNLERLSLFQEVSVVYLKNGDKIPEIHQNDLVIDAIFGSGLSKPIQGFVAEIIKQINESKAITIAIDAPSGLFCDENSTDRGGAIIEADYTLTFEFPKLAFLLPENDKFVGHWEILPIGLMREFTDGVAVQNFFIEKEDCQHILKARNKFAHKGTFGHTLIIAGSYGKMGAAVLSSKACLRVGAGLVTCHIPKLGYQILQTAIPECMLSIDDSDYIFGKVPSLEPYNAIGVGPGIGVEKQTQNALKLLIQNTTAPLVLDADAINILGENKTWISFLPPESILTPHPKEFERLVGKTTDNFARMALQRAFSIKNNVYVVLKGAHTCISTPKGKCFFNSTGNPGMATGGSGDVLTGIITGLLAQNYTSFDACILGVYLHGLAGDIAAEKISPESLIAGDIIKNIGNAFKKLRDVPED